MRAAGEFRSKSSPAPSLAGELDEFSFESYLGFPGEKEAAPAGTIHSVCEAKLGLTPVSHPLRPGM